MQNIIQLSRAVISQRELFKPNLSQFYAATELTFRLKSAIENLQIQNASSNTDILSVTKNDKVQTETSASTIQSDKISPPDLTVGTSCSTIHHGENDSASTAITKGFVDLSIWQQSQPRAAQTPKVDASPGQDQVISSAVQTPQVVASPARDQTTSSAVRVNYLQ